MRESPAPGIVEGVRARGGQQDRTAQVMLITEFEGIAHSPCGIPYVFGREIDVFDGLFLQPLDHYRKLGIDLRTETVVTAGDPGRKVVRAGGQEVPYDTLVLCTGWEYEPPTVPGLDLGGVIYLKNIRRAQEVERRLDGVKQAVVYRGKPLGLELVTALTHRGIETCLVDEALWLLSDFADPEMMAPVRESLQAAGARLHLSTALLGFGGEGGRLTHARTSAGDLPCEVAFVCTTMRQATTLARAMGLALGSAGAIAVDDHMRTSLPPSTPPGPAWRYSTGCSASRSSCSPGRSPIPWGKWPARTLPAPTGPSGRSMCHGPSWAERCRWEVPWSPRPWPAPRGSPTSWRAPPASPRPATTRPTRR